MGRKIETCNLREDAGANLVAIQRDRQLLHPTAKSEIQAGDILLLDLFSTDADIASMSDKYQLVALPLTGVHFTDRTQEIGMAELIVTADSDLVGKTVIQSSFSKPIWSFCDWLEAWYQSGSVRTGKTKFSA